VVVRNVFSKDDLAWLRQGCDELCQQAATFEQDTFVGVTFFNMFRDADPFHQAIDKIPVQAGKVRRVTYPYAVSKIFDAYRTHPNLLAVVASLLGDDIVQVVNQVNFNHPGGSAGWGWHQDYRFRRAGIVNPQTDFVQTLLAIDLCSLETGGLRVIPQSDRLGCLSLDKEPERAETYFDVKKAVTPELQPGDVICFNPLIIHGSTPNRSPWQRRVYINGFAKASIPFGLRVLNNGVPERRHDSKMEYEGDQATLPKASKY
jgi:ectoine hydroxylase-related dioxygenase (phytanoyl-CoA dioxygenase family)